MSTDDWDDAFHSFTIKLIKTQRELLTIRRQHEAEVSSLEEECENTAAKLEEAKLSVKALNEKKMDKKEKIQALNEELSEVHNRTPTRSQLELEAETEARSSPNQIPNRRCKACCSRPRDSITARPRP